MARVVGVAAKLALEESPAAPAAKRVNQLFVALALSALIATLAASIGQAYEDSAELRWESLACVLDFQLEVPYAWGIASALRGAPDMLVDARSSPARATSGWAVRAVADAHFVPVDACAALSSGGTALDRLATADGRAEAFDCARGTLLMAFVLSERFPIGMCVDELAAAASEIAQGLGARRLPLHLLKAALAVSAPGGGTLGYFVALHLDGAWECIARTIGSWTTV